MSWKCAANLQENTLTDIIRSDCNLLLQNALGHCRQLQLEWTLKTYNVLQGLNISHTFLYCYYYWLWTSKCLLWDDLKWNGPQDNFRIFFGCLSTCKKKDMIHRLLLEKLPLQNSSISLANNNAKICIPKISNWYTNSAKLLSVKES